MKHAILTAIFFLFTACHPKPAIQPTTFIKRPTIIIQTPDITYAARHQMHITDARTAAESLARSLQKYGMEWSWNNNEIIFKVTQGPLNDTHGKLQLTSSTITIEIYDLPGYIPHFIVMSKINGRIQAYFKSN